ncbi:MAG: hypothetical protein LC808_02995 [Actinobacteria bacterium]|nr:hypothetical protein [Actinomycetota bacterium]
MAVSRSGVWRILKRLGLNRLPASQRYQRRDRKWKGYEKQQPGHRVQIDVKFIEPWREPQPAPPAAARPARRPVPRRGRARGASTTSSAIDDCTRLRVLRIYPQCNQKCHPIRRLRLKAACRSGWRSSTPTTVPNSISFSLACAGQGHWSRLHQTPTPRLNSKVERSHRIDAEEFYRLLDGVVIDDAKVFNDKLPHARSTLGPSLGHRTLRSIENLGEIPRAFLLDQLGLRNFDV